MIHPKILMSRLRHGKKAFEGALKKDLFVLKLKEIVLSENDNPDRKDIEERPSNSNGVIIVSDRVIKHDKVNHTLE